MHELVRAPNALIPMLAARDRARTRRLPTGEYLALTTADGPALEAVAALADSLRRDVVGDEVTLWSTATSTSPTLPPVAGSGVRQRKGDADAYSLSVILERSPTGHGRSPGPPKYACRGGIDPELPVTGYADLVRAVKARVPSMHVCTRFPRRRSPTASPRWLEEWLIGLREAITIPGTAEILDDGGSLGAD